MRLPPSKSVIALLLVISFLVDTPSLTAQTSDPAQWESAIEEFEAADADDPPPDGAVLFIGSSSIKGWTTADEDFSSLDIINRGFGGSQFSDLIYYMDRIVLPYEPRTIVVYEGDNDIAAGKSPNTVFEDYRTFVDRVHEELPDTRIAFIAIKPSISRWHLAGEMRTANRMIRNYTLYRENLEFIDVWPSMLGRDGRPREEIFIEDGLHMNAAGYALWKERVRPFVVSPD